MNKTETTRQEDHERLARALKEQYEKRTETTPKPWLEDKYAMNNQTTRNLSEFNEDLAVIEGKIKEAKEKKHAAYEILAVRQRHVYEAEEELRLFIKNHQELLK